MTRSLWLFCCALCGALSLFATAAPAAPARLSFEAPPGCPGAEAFTAAVQSRGAHFDPGAGERLLQVAIVPEGNGFSGSVQLRQGEQSSARRTLRGPSCAEVSDALAVVAAIALEQDEPAAAVAVKVEAASAPPVLVARLDPPAPSAAPPEPARSVRLARIDESVDVPAGKLSFDVARSATLMGGAAFGVIPNLTLPRIDFDLSASSLVRTPGAADYLLGGEFRVRWSFLGVSTLQSPGFSTRVWGLKAGLGRCNPLIHNPQGFTLAACAEIAAGLFQLDTKDALGAKVQSKTPGIGTANLELSGRYRVASVFHLDLRAGGELWLGKLSAERPDGSRLFESSTFNGYALLGFGLDF